MGARFANADQAFLEAEDDFCKLEYKNEDLSDLTIRLDRSKILTSGRKGMFASTGQHGEPH
jgi:dipeptidyl-peptidase-3